MTGPRVSAGPHRVALTGNGACAEALRQIEPDMVAAYPITPQTEVVEEFSQFVADGRVGTRFVAVESEHSAMSACVGGAAAGGRAMTVTSSQGLAFMWEMLYIAAGLRLPIVMAVANRALSAPLNIHGDQSDAMGARDSGWIQLYCENPQEVYDTTVQAVRIAEDDNVRLPVMVCYDGFSVSHSLMDIEILGDGEVKEYVGEFKASYPLLDVDHPVTYGPLDLYDFYFEHRRQEAEAMHIAGPVIAEAGRLYGAVSGRSYALVEPYMLDDAELGLIVLGSTASTSKVAVDQLREEGVRAGILRIRAFRPFPKAELTEAVRGLRAVGVLDRADSLSGWGGPVGIETRAALFEVAERPAFADFVYGLGGRDVDVVDIRHAFQVLREAQEVGGPTRPPYYLGLRGG